MVEWLIRQPAKLVPFGSVSSNLTGVGFSFARPCCLGPGCRQGYYYCLSLCARQAQHCFWLPHHAIMDFEVPGWNLGRPSVDASSAKGGAAVPSKEGAARKGVDHSGASATRGPRPVAPVQGRGEKNLEKRSRPASVASPSTGKRAPPTASVPQASRPPPGATGRRTAEEPTWSATLGDAIGSTAKSVADVKEPRQDGTSAPGGGAPSRPLFSKASNRGAASRTVAKAHQKLAGARFRFLSQRLYESSSEEALEYFKQHPDSFLHYHEGFRGQSRCWPTNPVTIFSQKLSAILDDRRPDEEAPRSSEAEGGAGRGRKLVVADLGCGDGAIGAAFAAPEHAKKVIVHSFDLAAIAPHITVASMTAVPLPDASVDVAIFSLALMNTDYAKAIEEANRILRTQGHLWIAEVASRFGGERGLGEFTAMLKRLGFKMASQVRAALQPPSESPTAGTRRIHTNAVLPAAPYRTLRMASLRSCTRKSLEAPTRSTQQRCRAEGTLSCGQRARRRQLEGAHERTHPPSRRAYIKNDETAIAPPHAASIDSSRPLGPYL